MSKLAIYAGHGGSDPGAVSGSREEKDYTLLLSLTVKSKLQKAGHTVITNRTTDADSTIDEKVRLADSQKVDAIIEIHLNSGGGHGSEVYCSITGKGKTLADNILSSLVAYGYTNRGIKTKENSDGTADYFGIIRRPDAQSVLVETCFIDSDSDMKQLNTDQVGAVIANGILKSFPPKAEPVAPSKPEPPTTKPSGGLKVGDTVTLNGYVYTDSFGEGRGQYFKNKTGKITIVADKSRKCPYHFEELGWVTPESIGKSAGSADFKTGDKIKVKTSATRFATGEKMLSFVPGGTYYIRETAEDRVLISPKMSGDYTGWVYKSDIEKA